MNTAMIARVLAALRAVKDSPPGQIPRDYWHACTLAHNELEAATHHQVIDKVDAEPQLFSYEVRPFGKHGEHQGFRIKNGEGWVIADVAPLNMDGRGGEENARLFCGARRLLAALKSLLHEDGGSLAMSKGNPACVEARAALAATREGS